MSEQLIGREYLDRHQRLLECWLPLAQQVMQDIGAPSTPEQLEALIIAAAAELAETDSATTARAVLWRQQLRNQSKLT
jgi:hypothetical protein